MYVTEEEAKTKRCRFYMNPVIVNDEIMHQPLQVVTINNGACIGSECMSWEFIDDAKGQPTNKGFCTGNP